MNYQALIGTKLGQFELKEVIGAGGMGAVFRAYQHNLERDVAVKVLPVELGTEQAFIDRFIREAKVVGKLEHPNIIPIYGFDAEDELTYVAMRLLTGGSLMDRLQPRNSDAPMLPSPTEAARLLRQIASALDYAHSNGIIHRDIKPGNVMFDQRGVAYLLDFGIAKLMDATQALTAVGTTMGTPIFMAPEQWRTENVSPNTDQYAMGVLMYFTMVGSPPFQARTAPMLMQLHLDASPPSIHRLRPDIPSEVDFVIERAMSKYINDRFPSMEAFADAFERAIQRATPSEPTQFFRPQGIFADTNKKPQVEPTYNRPTTRRTPYTPKPTTPSGGIRIPEEDTARRNPPQSAIETYQGNTPLPKIAHQSKRWAWIKSPITWLLILFFVIFGAVAYFLTRSDSNNSGLTNYQRTQTAVSVVNPAQTAAILTQVAAETVVALSPTTSTTRFTVTLAPTSTDPPTMTLTPTPTRTITPSPTPLKLTARITGNQTNVRAGPNTNFSIVETLEQGESIEVYFIDDANWAYIGFNEKYGWVLSTLLNISGDSDDLPTSVHPPVVRCELGDIVSRYNAEWTELFWQLGCPDEEIIVTNATLHQYANGIAFERDDTDETYAVRTNGDWAIFQDTQSLTSDLSQFLSERRPTGTETVQLHILRYPYGYAYDFNDETDVQILLDINRIN